MKELGKFKFDFRMAIDHDQNCDTPLIRQTWYIDDVVRRFNQQDAKAVAKIYDSRVKLSKMQSLTTDSDKANMK